MRVNGSRLGFVSTRLAGTDGVSLEVRKWAEILERLGHTCYFFAGEVDHPPDRSVVLPEAHFDHPAIRALTKKLFETVIRDPSDSRLIVELEQIIKRQLHSFAEEFEIDLLIVENALSLPMNIPLGLALTELVAETGLPTIAHHHDFAWERKRFSVSAVDDLLRTAFPPTLPTIRHVVINSFARKQLALRAGISSILIPNVMDFESPPPQPDDFTRNLRQTLGIAESETLVLQPTRIVPRKRIELAIDLVRRLGRDSVLLITHSSGDEGTEYLSFLLDYALLHGVHVILGDRFINHDRGERPDGQPVFSLADAYFNADLVAYPSAIEGFGNALLETLYFCRPIVVSDYEIFRADILPKGFEVVLFDHFITDDTLEQVRRLLNNPKVTDEMVAKNYNLGRRHYSFTILESALVTLLEECLGG
jgi:glycosyltransferase involved in cell wall biosynthesis